MKKLLTICLFAAMCISLSAEAAQPSSKENTKEVATKEVATKEVKTSKKVEAKVEIVTTQFMTDIDCPDCEKKIMNKIPFEKGVSDVKVDLKSKIVTVDYDKSKNSDSSLIKSFKKIKIEAKVIVPRK